MKKVFQTTFGEPLGNCFPACLASLLEVPLDVFPFPPYEDNWMQQVDKTLQKMGYAYVEWAGSIDFSWAGKFLCIVHGISPRGLRHSVIAKHFIDEGMHKYEFKHDPHPDGGWIKDVEGVGVLIPSGRNNEKIDT